MPSLAAIRAALPPLDDESAIRYARRLYTAYPHLTLEQLAELSHAKIYNLRADPSFAPLPIHLAATASALPRIEGETGAAYARRLLLHHPQLSIDELSRVSGVAKGALKQDPTLQPMPLHLRSVRAAYPKFDAEDRTTYARRLHEARPELALHDLALISGAREAQLKRDPTFKPVSSALAAIAEANARLNGENGIAYAERLKSMYPDLEMEDLSLLSGATLSNLSRNPAFGRLPSSLAEFSASIPREHGEKALAYAQRVKKRYPDIPLADLAMVAGVKKEYLKASPLIIEKLPDLAPVANSLPRWAGESATAYARRLHTERPELTIEQLSQLSGVTKSTLRRDPTLKDVPAALAAVAVAMPKADAESTISYARRLGLVYPELQLADLAALSGAPESTLRRDPAFKVVSPELAAIAEAIPRLKGENATAYARRLQRHRPALTIAQLSLLSGVEETRLQRDPAFLPLSDNLVAIQRALPRFDKERSAAYARRLHVAHPALPLCNLSRLSGAAEASLRKDPTFKLIPDKIVAIMERLPRARNEAALNYARRLRATFPDLSIEELSLASQATLDTMRRDPAFKDLPPELAQLAERTPKMANETSTDYARRLVMRYPSLSLRQLSQLTGVAVGTLKARVVSTTVDFEHMLSINRRVETILEGKDLPED